MNFHNHISIPLENITNKFLSSVSNLSVISADTIDNGAFMSTVTFLLYAKFGASEKVAKFINKNSQNFGLKQSEIDLQTAIDIYNEFCYLFEQEDA